MRLSGIDDILQGIQELQMSPWYNDGKEPESGRRLQYNVRKEAVEIVRDLCVKNAPTIDAIPLADAKKIVDIALYVISKMEDFGCAYVWEKSGDPDADENNVRAECQEYRRKIKEIMGEYDNGSTD